MTKHITKKQVLLLMLIIFCMIPLGCSGRHDNNVIEKQDNDKPTTEEKTKTEITAFTAVNGQMFHGILDPLRNIYDKDEIVNCNKKYEANYANFYLETLVLQEQEHDAADKKTMSTKFRAFNEEKPATPLYKFESTTCDEKDIVAYSFQTPDEENGIYKIASLVPNRWENLLIATYTIKNLTQTMNFTKDSYYYIYPKSTEDSGITLNVIEASLTIEFSNTTINEEFDENGELQEHEDFEDQNLDTIKKFVKLKIETTDGTFYTTIDEAGEPNSFDTIVTVDLYKDAAQKEPLNYEMVLDYTDHKIRFEKTSSNE